MQKPILLFLAKLCYRVGNFFDDLGDSLDYRLHNDLRAGMNDITSREIEGAQ